MTDNHVDLQASESVTEDDDSIIDGFVTGGSRDVVLALGDVRKTCGGPAAMGYAGGMVAGLRAWLVTNHGLENTRELFLRMADDADLCEQPPVLQ